MARIIQYYRGGTPPFDEAAAPVVDQPVAQLSQPRRPPRISSAAATFVFAAAAASVLVDDAPVSALSQPKKAPRRPTDALQGAPDVTASELIFVQTLPLDQPRRVTRRQPGQLQAPPDVTAAAPDTTPPFGSVSQPRKAARPRLSQVGPTAEAAELQVNILPPGWISHPRKKAPQQIGIAFPAPDVAAAGVSTDVPTPALSQPRSRPRAQPGLIQAPPDVAVVAVVDTPTGAISQPRVRVARPRIDQLQAVHVDEAYPFGSLAQPKARTRPKAGIAQAPPDVTPPPPFFDAPIGVISKPVKKRPQPSGVVTQASPEGPFTIVVVDTGVVILRGIPSERTSRSKFRRPADGRFQQATEPKDRPASTPENQSDEEALS